MIYKLLVFTYLVSSLCKLYDIVYLVFLAQMHNV
jgi:hypothetical protein